MEQIKQLNELVKQITIETGIPLTNVKGIVSVDEKSITLSNGVTLTPVWDCMVDVKTETSFENSRGIVVKTIQEFTLDSSNLANWTRQIINKCNQIKNDRTFLMLM